MDAHGGASWWCVLGGVRTEFNFKMKYLLDCDLLVLQYEGVV